jgi:hypothetical protein
MAWDDARLDQTEQRALACTSEDACTVDVVSLIGEVRRLRAALEWINEHTTIVVGRHRSDEDEAALIGIIDVARRALRIE